MRLGSQPACGTRRVLGGLGCPAAVGRPAAVGLTSRHGLHVCRAAASDEKSRSEPMYLSDLIAFETDLEGSSSPASSGSSLSSSTFDASSSNGSSSSSSGLAGSLGLASSEVDPTHRAQDIINRATEVLAAARAALGTPAAGPSSSGSANPTTASSAPVAAAPAAGSTFISPSDSSSSSKPSSSSPPAGYATQQRLSAAPSSSSTTSSSGLASSPANASTLTGGPALSSSSGTSDSGMGGSSASEPLTRRWSQLSDGQDLTRHVLQNALDQMQSSGTPIAAPPDSPGSSSSSRSTGPGSGPRSSAAAAASAAGGGVKYNRDLRSSSSSGGGRRGGGSLAADGGHSPAPSWAQSLLGSDDFGGSGGYGPGSLFPPEPQLQPQAAAMPAALAFADDEAPTYTLPPVALSLLSQSVLDAQKAKAAVLPPLQSVVELTSAFKPPERSGAAPAAAVEVDAVTGEALAAAAPVGKALADGSGRLADGTWWEKKSGIEYGKNGYWKRWQLLKGGSADGSLQWEETWWEASDYTGLKEMGAEKKGNNADGAAWREFWSERLMYASNDLDCVVERNAHKWAAEGNGDEWEEKWGEHYHASGKVAKFADKWGKSGPNVWHERWGEDYDSSGDACVKWTDKWAERLLPGGAREQWGDKWHEAFASGRGEKNGEVWNVNAAGERYQRWWGEQHLGDRRVRRHGHSTSGEVWDETIEMDTYYNPVPHFGFKLALQHSPQLRNVPLKPKPIDEKDPFGPGLDQL